MGLVLPVLTSVALGVTMARSGAGLDDRYLGISWQLVDLPVLRDDPFGSAWYLHVQPPVFNLVVGSVLRWSPTPPIGTLFVLYMACVALTGLVIADLGARWRINPIVAGLVASAALVDPDLLGTITGASYEVPVVAGLAVAVWLVHQHIDHPRPRLLVGAALALTGVAMTRSAFHPAWVLAVLGLVILARPVGRRATVLALAVPVLVLGGWMAKNQIVFGEPTTSSWVGFNLQRGVTAPMERAAVERAVASGAVTPLALEHPFSSLRLYDEATDCDPDLRHPAVSKEYKEGARPAEVANFNNSCYLDLYAESEENARALLRRHPGRYLATRPAGLLVAFRTSELGVRNPRPTFIGPMEPSRTWIDGFAAVAYAPVPVSLSVDDWNLPLLDVDRITMEVSITLMAGFLILPARAGGVP